MFEFFEVTLRRADCILRLNAFHASLCGDWLRCTCVAPNVFERVESLAYKNAR